MKTRTFLLAIVAIACMSACGDSKESTLDTAAEQQTLNNNIALWQRSNISAYQYTFGRRCYCGPEEDIVVVVVNGQVSQAFRTPSGTYLTAQELPNVFPIEGMFNKVQDAINQRVASLRVTYNASFGYPENISIDRDSRLVDDEIAYVARNFQ